MSAEINLPTPITPEARRADQWVCLDSRLFAYGPNDYGTVAWYKEKYSDFMDDQYTIFEMYSNGMTPKQHRNLLKMLCRKSKELTTCYRYTSAARSASTHPSSRAIARSTSR